MLCRKPLLCTFVHANHGILLKSSFNFRGKLYGFAPEPHHLVHDKPLWRESAYSQKALNGLLTVGADTKLSFVKEPNMTHRDLFIEINAAALLAEANGFVKTAEALIDLGLQLKESTDINEGDTFPTTLNPRVGILA